MLYFSAVLGDGGGSGDIFCVTVFHHSFPFIGDGAGGAGMLKLPFSPNIVGTAASNRFERTILFVIFS